MAVLGIDLGAANMAPGVSLVTGALSGLLSDSSTIQHSVSNNRLEAISAAADDAARQAQGTPPSTGGPRPGPSPAIPSSTARSSATGPSAEVSVAGMGRSRFGDYLDPETPSSASYAAAVSQEGAHGSGGQPHRQPSSLSGHSYSSSSQLHSLARPRHARKLSNESQFHGFMPHGERLAGMSASSSSSSKHGVRRRASMESISHSFEGSSGRPPAYRGRHSRKSSREDGFHPGACRPAACPPWPPGEDPRGRPVRCLVRQLNHVPFKVKHRRAPGSGKISNHI